MRCGSLNPSWEKRTIVVGWCVTRDLIISRLFTDISMLNVSVWNALCLPVDLLSFDVGHMVPHSKISPSGTSVGVLSPTVTDRNRLWRFKPAICFHYNNFSFFFRLTPVGLLRVVGGHARVLKWVCPNRGTSLAVMVQNVTAWIFLYQFSFNILTWYSSHTYIMYFK